MSWLRVNWPIVLGIALTVIWGLIAASCLTIFSRWREFSTLTLNEIGDAFAGFFAPLAFLWLVVAVLIQSKELKLAVSEYRTQSLALKGTQEVQTLQIALSLFDKGIEVLRTIAIDILLQMISLDEHTPSSASEPADILYAPQEGYSVFKLKGKATKPAKLEFHKSVKSNLTDSLSRVADGDFNAIFALALRVVDQDGLEVALREPELRERCSRLKSDSDRYECVRKSLIDHLKKVDAPNYLLEVIERDHPAKFGDLLEAATRRALFHSIYRVQVRP